MVDVDISLHDVAEALHVHYMTAYRYVREGMLPARKVGRSWCVRKSDLNQFQKGFKDSPLFRSIDQHNTNSHAKHSNA